MNQHQLTAKLAELSEIHITLDADPTLVGLDAFNDKLAQLDSYNERLGELIQEALAYKGDAEIAKIEAEAVYDQAYGQSLAGDAEIQKLRSNDIRKAKLDAQHQELLSAKNAAIVAYTRAEVYLKRVQQKYRDLEAKTERLYKQFDVVRQLLHLDPSTRQDLMERATGGLVSRPITLKTSK